MTIWILVMMINGQILIQEFHDKESCIFAGKVIAEQYKIYVFNCVYKGDRK